jgi:hypothetical protein
MEYSMEAKDDNRFVQSAIRIFSYLLLLYPRRFRSIFADEMLDVFTEEIGNAADEGSISVAGALLREAAELPVALISQYIYERRRQVMSILQYDNKQEVMTARWVARGISLFFGGFFLLIFVLNDDVRNDPTLPTLIFGMITLAMLIAWRWEKIGGILTIFLSPIFLLTIFFQWFGAKGLMTSPWVLGVISAGMMFAFFITGWLFVSVAQYYEVLQDAEADKDEAVNPRKRRWTVLLIGLLGVFVIGFFLVSVNFPVQQEMEYPHDAQVAPDYEFVINQLRAQGSLIGIGSIPVDQSLFTVTGLEINMDGEIVHLFKYDKVESATKNAAAISDGTSPGLTGINGVDRPRYYQVRNVLVLYSGSDESTVTRIEGAFGPPFFEE